MTRWGAYCSRARVRDLARVGRPLVVVPVLVGEGSVKDVADVSHGVDTHCRAFEHRAEGEMRDDRMSHANTRQQLSNKGAAKDYWRTEKVLAFLLNYYVMGAPAQLWNA